MSFTATEALRFHFKHGWFNVREQFSDLASGIAGFLLFPFFIWLVSALWKTFNAYQGNYTIEEVMLYVGVTEILFMTFLRLGSLGRASSDFSLSLARPRSWLATSFSGLYGRCFGGRIIYLAIFLVAMPLLGAPFASTLKTGLRLLLFFPLLGVFQAFVGLLFSCAQVRWSETSYFVLPVSKVFLALGGVFGPLVDYSEPWKSLLLKLPPSDVFFQPAHFCVKGHFYGMTGLEWVARVSATCLALFALSLAFHRNAREHHQSWGG